jgi:hypothetical protein
MGDRDLSGRLRRRRDGSQNTGMAAGVPESRKAARQFAQGFTRDDSPGEDEWPRLPSVGFAF